ncbi:MAG TPA: hypothetical protein VI815_03680 [Candidatus Nanoarchaeia archaeon]|nr:hypothetical protein [Candidatus Nanoarchaeia archaeon]
MKTNLISKLSRIGAGAIIGLGAVTSSSIARADEAEIAKIQAEIAQKQQELEEAKIKDEQEKAAENRLGTVRTKVEYNSQGEGTSLTKYTLGFSPSQTEPKSPYAKFDETFRLYQTNGELNGGDYKDTQLNILLPFKSLDSKLILYSQDESLQFDESGRESQGLGAQYIYDDGKVLFSAFADQRTDDLWEFRYHELTIPSEITGLEEDKTITIREKASWEEKFTHIGAYADYESDSHKWIIGAGFDQVRGPEGTENSALVKARFFPTENDQFGIAFHTSNDTSTNSTTNTIAGVYGHYGNEEKIGTRAIGIYSWNNETDNHNMELKLRIVQNPIFSRDFPYDWPTDNRPDDGGQFSKNQLALPFDLENYDPHYHCEKGLFGELKMNLGDNAGIVNGAFSAEAGYAWTPWDNSKIAASALFKHEFTASDLEDISARDSIGGKLYFQRGRTELQLKATQSLGEDPNTGLYGSFQYQFGIPKPSVVDVANGTYKPKEK